jgi:isocitrate dehydrogenase (NAD+)
MHRVVFVRGGGIGIDQELAVRKIISACNVDIEWKFFDAGWAAQSHGANALSDEMLSAIRDTASR